MNIKPLMINGLWRYGIALDWHTISSVPRAAGGFETTRTDIGEALYQLKYRFDRSKIEPIAAVTAQQIKQLRVFSDLQAIITVPPSKLDRPFQPVLELANAISKKINVPVAHNYLIKVKQTQALKEIDNNELRRQQLQEAFKIADQRYLNKAVLLFDDLFRSGETLNAVCNALTNQGQVKRIYVVTITRTRTKR